MSVDSSLLRLREQGCGNVEFSWYCFTKQPPTPHASSSQPGPANPNLPSKRIFAGRSGSMYSSLSQYGFKSSRKNSLAKVLVYLHLQSISHDFTKQRIMTYIKYEKLLIFSSLWTTWLSLCLDAMGVVWFQVTPWNLPAVSGLHACGGQDGCAPEIEPWNASLLFFMDFHFLELKMDA